MTQAYELAREYSDKLSETFHLMYPEDDTIASLFKMHIDSGAWAELWEQSARAAERLIGKSEIG